MKVLATIFLALVSTCSQAADLAGAVLFHGSAITRANTLRRHMVMLDSPNGSCSGVLVGSGRVLTAAHCLAYGLQKAVFYSGAKTVAAERDVTGTKAHPLYREGRPNGQDFDLALVTFAGEVAGFAPATLLPAGGDAVGKGEMITLMGFGLTSPEEPSGNSPGLYTSDLSVVRIDYGQYPYWEARGDGEMLGACPGDSGGGAFVKRGANYYLAGLITRKLGSTKCTNSPGTVLIDLGLFAGWIGGED